MATGGDLTQFSEQSEHMLSMRSSERSVAQSIYKTLRQSVVNFDLPPDTILSRKDLASEFAVSLTPIREALQQLEQDGLVRIRPQSSTVVTRIDETQLKEAQFLRLAVESEVVRQLAETANEAVVKNAKAIVDMQAALVGDTGQMAMFTELDRSFHRTLFEGAGMKNLHAMVARQQGHLARCQRLELPKSGKMQEIVSFHRKILEAIKAGKPKKAVDAMRFHLGGTIHRLDSLRKDYPDYFTDGTT
jgi:DNA-binding GntR family transcriptional regulator